MKLATATVLVTALLAKAEMGGMLFCTGVNATGDCHYDVYSLEECHDYPEGFAQNAQTWAIDGDGHECLPYTLHCADWSECRSSHGCHRGILSDFNEPQKWNFTWYTFAKAFKCRDASLYQ